LGLRSPTPVGSLHPRLRIPRRIHAPIFSSKASPWNFSWERSGSNPPFNEYAKDFSILIYFLVTYKFKIGEGGFENLPAIITFCLLLYFNYQFLSIVITKYH